MKHEAIMSEDSLDTGELLVLDARTLLDLPSTTRRTRDDDDDDDVGDQAEDDHLQVGGHCPASWENRRAPSPRWEG